MEINWHDPDNRECQRIIEDAVAAVIRIAIFDANRPIVVDRIFDTTGDRSE